MQHIKQNLAEINNRIAEAAAKFGTSASDIMLVGVTKTIDEARIAHLLECGVTNLGENRVQELLPKIDALGEKPTWHLIGHLQSNKARQVVGKVALIHSVDSLSLAKEIDARATKAGIVQNILIEVNAAGEDTKFGLAPNDVCEFAKNITNFGNIRLNGLMTVAPFVENAENNRVYFKKMYELFVDIKQKINDNIDMKYLSMGMTNDYDIAIEEGANIVRIGTGIFGERNY